MSGWVACKGSFSAKTVGADSFSRTGPASENAGPVRAFCFYMDFVNFFVLIKIKFKFRCCFAAPSARIACLDVFRLSEGQAMLFLAVARVEVQRQIP